MEHIKVWCEYDFSGGFGGNNNEEIFEVSTSLDEDVEKAVVSYLMKATGLDDPDDLEDLYGWGWYEVKTLV